MATFLAAAALASAPGSAIGAPGDLDQAFGPGGTTTVDFGGDEGGIDAAVQPDGKIVVAGFENTATSDFLIARLNPDGSTDASFGTDGRARLDFGGRESASAVAIQPDGKIVVVGDTTAGFGGSLDFAIGRLNGDGSPDAGFGSAGRATVHFAIDDTASAVALQLDGRIVVAGQSTTPGNRNFALARLTPSGAPDGTFGFAGTTTSSIYAVDIARDVAIAPDGRIIVVGGVRNDTTNRDEMGIAAFMENGGSDLAFGGGGTGTRTLTFPGADDASASGVAIQAGGAIVAVGTASAGGRQDIVVARLNGQGLLDGAFGEGGRVSLTSQVYSDTQARAAAIQPDGRIVISGTAAQASETDFLAARLTTDGAPDPAFGPSGDGTTTASIGPNDAGLGLALDPSGRIVVAGETGGNVGDFAVVRFLGDPLALDITAKKKQPGQRLKVTATCSRDCTVSIQGKGKAGGDKFKAKLAEEVLTAGVPETIRLKLKKGVARDVKGEAGKATFTATAVSGPDSAADAAKSKLKGH